MLYGVEYESRKIGSLNCDEVAEEPLYCGGCGQKVDELEPCAWDPTLEVGACCRLHSDEHPELVFGLTSPTEMPRLEPIRVQVREYKGVA